jgi:hypothetical protein
MPIRGAWVALLLGRIAAPRVVELLMGREARPEI